MTLKKGILWRFGLILLVFVLIMLLILFKTLSLMTTDRNKWLTFKSPGNKPIREVVISPNRGDICAEDGRILATSIPYYEIRFDPIAVKKSLFNSKVDSLAYHLSKFFGDNSKSYYSRLLKNARNRRPRPNRYLLINRRKVNYLELKKLKTFPIFRKGRNKGGFNPIISDVRTQPHRDLASRTIGNYAYTAKMGKVGTSGLEYQFQGQLKGKNGLSENRIMSGRWLLIPKKEPEDGLDVVTTIDVDFQDIVQNALRKQLTKYEAKNGTAILMEVNTGDIKAIANLSRCSDGRYEELTNLAIADAAEPGSVIKTASLICLLEDGIYNINDTIDMGGKGYYVIYGRTLRDSHGKAGRVPLSEVFEHSLNGLAKIIYDNYKNDPKRFVNRWYSMRLNKKTEIELPGEALPLIKHPDKNKDWSGITLPWMSIGYELKIAPIQLLAFYNAIANNGQRMKPRLVKELRNRGSVVKEFPIEEVGAKICSKETLKQIRSLLKGVVTEGTARNIYTDKYSIAGKTGTAKIASGSSGYSRGNYKASFVGYFPADKPLYSCVVVINNPTKGSYYGNTVSGSVFREISDRVYAMSYIKHGRIVNKKDFSLPMCKNGFIDDFENIYNTLDIDYKNNTTNKDLDWVRISSTENKKKEVLRSLPENSSLVPNVKGMGLRDALFLLENAKLKVGVSGSGRVVTQSIIPGTKAVKGNYISIRLE